MNCPRRRHGRQWRPCGERGRSTSVPRGECPLEGSGCRASWGTVHGIAMVIWPGVAGFLFTGYLAMARSFAYLGVPPLFIGEIVLGAFLLLKPRAEPG